MYRDLSRFGFFLKGSHMKDQKTEQTPEQRIKELEQKLAETQLKAEFFEAVVTVMKRDYGVSLPKKQQEMLSKKKRSKH